MFSAAFSGIPVHANPRSRIDNQYPPSGIQVVSVEGASGDHSEHSQLGSLFQTSKLSQLLTAASRSTGTTGTGDSVPLYTGMSL